MSGTKQLADNEPNYSTRRVLALRWTDIVHMDVPKKCMRVRLKGECKTWKRDINRVRQPVMHGIGPSGGYITEDGVSYPYFGIYNAPWHLESECTRQP